MLHVACIDHNATSMRPPHVAPCLLLLAGPTKCHNYSPAHACVSSAGLPGAYLPRRIIPNAAPLLLCPHPLPMPLLVTILAAPPNHPLRTSACRSPTQGRLLRMLGHYLLCGSAGAMVGDCIRWCFSARYVSAGPAAVSDAAPPGHFSALPSSGNVAIVNISISRTNTAVQHTPMATLLPPLISGTATPGCPATGRG
jgi:hypothetical protein